MKTKCIFQVMVTLLVVILSAPNAMAYIWNTESEKPKTIEADIRAEFMRGTMMPHHYTPDSYQNAKTNFYTVGASYRLGELGNILKSTRARLAVGMYSSDQETTRGAVVHPADNGTIVSARYSGNWVEKEAITFGSYLQLSQPLGVNLSKFSLPRVDAVSLGVTFVSQLTEWLSYDALVYWGSGITRSSGQQRPMIATSNLLGVRHSRWFLPHPISFKIGPYFETETSSRNDNSWDSALSEKVPQQSFRFGPSLLLSLGIAEDLSLEAGYVEKRAAFFPKSSEDFSFALKGSF